MNIRRRTRLFFGLLLLALAGTIVVANIWKSGLVVKHFTVTGNRIVETSEILQLAQIEPNTRMYDLDLMAVQRNVLSHHFLKAVVVERDLPSTIRIRVEERTPVALLQRGELCSVDADGVILPQTGAQQLFDLPVISGLDKAISLKPGMRILNTDLQEAIGLLSAARTVNKELYYLISEVRLRDSGDIVLYATEGGLPILFGRGSPVKKLLYLEAFWNDVVRERGSQGLEYIDLRFDDQIVVRWSASHAHAGYSS